MIAALNNKLASGQIAFEVIDGEPYVKVGADAPRPFIDYPDEFVIFDSCTYLNIFNGFTIKMTMHFLGTVYKYINISPTSSNSIAGNVISVNGTRYYKGKTEMTNLRNYNELVISNGSTDSAYKTAFLKITLSKK